MENETKPKRKRAYAETTQAPSDRTRADIQKLLVKKGATHFAYAMEPGMETVMFALNGRRIKLTLPLPDRDDDRVLYTPSNKWMRSPREQDKAYEQLVRSSWRALYLIIKAKIEAVELGITTFEDEFLANTVLPNQQTVSEYIQPVVVEIYETGKMPTALPSEMEQRQALTASFVEN